MKVKVINIKEIKNLMFTQKYSIYEIAKGCNIPSRTSLNNARNKENIENLTLNTLVKLQEFINEKKG